MQLSGHKNFAGRRSLENLYAFCLVSVYSDKELTLNNNLSFASIDKNVL